MLIIIYRCLICCRWKIWCVGEWLLCLICIKNGYECLGYFEDKWEGVDIVDMKNVYEDGNVIDGDGEEVFDNINGVKVV